MLALDGAAFFLLASDFLIMMSIRLSAKQKLLIFYTNLYQNIHFLAQEKKLY